MMRIHFTPRDLARTTVAVAASPLLEVLLSLRVLRRQDGGLVFGNWRQRVHTEVPREQLEPLFELAKEVGRSPGLLAPALDTASFEEALRAVITVDRSAAALRDYHRAAIAPYWRSISAHVTSENAVRGDSLAWQGVDLVLATLHPRVVWSPPVLQLLDLPGPDLHLEGRGIKLQLSAFCWRAPAKLLDPRSQPILVLPIQHTVTLLRPGGVEPPRALAAVLGPTRAAALDAAIDPCTTSELARRCNITPSAASYHAGILRQAGLISSRRERSAVLHQTTPLGRRLLFGSTVIPAPAPARPRPCGPG